jgi:hypothetical protein
MDFKDFKSEMERKNADKLRKRLRKYEKGGVDPFEAVAANIVGTLRTKPDRDLERLLALLQENEAAYNAAVKEAHTRASSSRKRSASGKCSASRKRSASPRTRKAHEVLKKAMRARAFSRKNGTARNPRKQGSTTILSIHAQPARPNAPRARRGSLLSISFPPNTDAVKFGPLYVYNGTNNPPLTKEEKEKLLKNEGFTQEEH